MLTPGQLIRQTRLRRGLTQRQLAIRAGTAQAAISRLERDEISPTFETIKTMLLVMGEEPQLKARRLETRYDPIHMADNVKRPPDERLTRSLAWNRLALTFREAGRRIGLHGQA